MTKPNDVWIRMAARTFIVRFDDKGEWTYVFERLRQQHTDTGTGYYYNACRRSRRNHKEPQRGIIFEVLEEVKAVYKRRPSF